MVCVGEERTVGIAVVAVMAGCIVALDSDCPGTYEEAGITTTVVDEEANCTAVADIVREPVATAVGLRLANAVPVNVRILGVAEENETVLVVKLRTTVVSAELTAELATGESAVEMPAVKLAVVVILAISVPTGDGTIPSLAAASSLASHRTVTPV